MRFYSQAQKIPVGQSMFSVIEFTFSKEWKDFIKIVQFKQYSNAYNVAITDDHCYVPSELLVGKCSLRIKGYSKNQQDVIATANELILTCVQGFESGGVPPVPPTPDLYQKLIANVFPSNPKAGNVLAAKVNISGSPFVSALEWVDMATVSGTTQVYKAIASESATEIILQCDPNDIITSIKELNKTVLIIQINTGASDTYTIVRQYIPGFMLINRHGASEAGTAWSVPESTDDGFVMHKLSFIEATSDGYKWSITKYKIPLEEVTSQT